MPSAGTILRLQADLLTTHYLIQIFHLGNGFISNISFMVIKHGIYLIPDSLLDIWIPGQLVQTERHCG
jgi:hypothetical protein